MVYDVISEESIKVLINTFYQKVQKDELLRPLFEAKIGNTAQQWAPHLETMYDFWSAIMLKTGRYQGNPMRKHKDLLPFDETLFDQWLALFAQTAREVHTQTIADEYIKRSQTIASSLRYALYNKIDQFAQLNLK